MQVSEIKVDLFCNYENYKEQKRKAIDENYCLRSCRLVASAIVYLPKTLLNFIPESIYKRSAVVCRKTLFYSCRAVSSALYEVAVLENSEKNVKRFARWCVKVAPSLKYIERSLPAKATLLTCRAIYSLYTHSLGYGIRGLASFVSLGEFFEILNKITEIISTSDSLKSKLADKKRSMFQQFINNDQFRQEAYLEIMGEFADFFNPAIELISESANLFKKTDCERLILNILRHSNESSCLSDDIVFSFLCRIVSNRTLLMLKTAFHMFSGDPSKQVNKEFRNLTNFMESSVFYQIKSLLKAEGANKFVIDMACTMSAQRYLYTDDTDIDYFFSPETREKIVAVLSKKMGSALHEELKIKAKNKRDEIKRIDRPHRENNSVKPERSQSTASTAALLAPPAMTFNEIENACKHLLKKPSSPGNKSSKNSNKIPEQARVIPGPGVQAEMGVLDSNEKTALYDDLQSVFQGKKESLINLKKCLDSLETFSWNDQAILRRCTTYTLQPDDDKDPVPVFHISAGKRGSPETVTVFFARLDNKFECLAVARHKGISKGATTYTCEYQNDRWKVPKHLSYGVSRNIRPKVVE